MNTNTLTRPSTHFGESLPPLKNAPRPTPGMAAIMGPTPNPKNKLEPIGPRGGSPKITFLKNGKKHTRVIQVNKRGTKCVTFEGELIPISKLKQV